MARRPPRGSTIHTTTAADGHSVTDRRTDGRTSGRTTRDSCRRDGGPPRAATAVKHRTYVVKLDQLASIEDRGQTDRVAVLASHNRNSNPNPYGIDL